MTLGINASQQRMTGSYSLPGNLAEFIIEVAHPANLAEIALVGQFNAEIQTALEKYSSLNNVNNNCQNLGFDQIIDYLQTLSAHTSQPMLSIFERPAENHLLPEIPSKFDLAILTPPFIQMQRLPESLREQLHKTVSTPLYFPLELAYLEVIYPLLKGAGSAIALVSELALRQAGYVPARDFILGSYEVDFVVLLPSMPFSAIRSGVIKLTHRLGSTTKPTLYAIASNWSDLPALSSILRLYGEIGRQTFLDIEMNRIGKSALFSLTEENTLTYETFLPSQLYYARYIQSRFEQYETVKLDDVAEISLGIQIAQIAGNLEGDQKRVITAKCITPDGNIQNPESIPARSLEGKKQKDHWTLQEGDLLVSRWTNLSQPSQLRLAIVPSELAGTYFDSTVTRLRVRPNKWGLNSDYIFRIMAQQYELRPGFAEFVEQQLNALRSGPTVSPSVLKQLYIPILPEAIRQRLGGHIDLIDLENALRSHQRQLEILTRGLDQIKAQSSLEGTDIEDIIEQILERLVEFNKLIDQRDVETYRVKLCREVSLWDQLETESQQFLLAAEWSLANLPPELEFSTVSVSVWKCLETELLAKVFTPFCQWLRERECDVDTFLAVDLGKGTKTNQFAKFAKNPGKFTIGEMSWEFNLVGGKDTVGRSPLLQSFREFLGNRCAKPDFFLEQDKGINDLISQGNVDKYRNSAVHTGIFDRDKALHSRDFVVRNLDPLIKAIGSKRTDVR